MIGISFDTDILAVFFEKMRDADLDIGCLLNHLSNHRLSDSVMFNREIVEKYCTRRHTRSDLIFLHAGLLTGQFTSVISDSLNLWKFGSLAKYKKLSVGNAVCTKICDVQLCLFLDY